MKELKFKAYSSIKDIKQISSEEAGNTIEISGLATQAKFADGTDAIDRDGEIVDYRGFKLSAKVFLYMHDLTMPIGTVKLYEDSDGIRYQATVHENSNPTAYYNIKNKIVQDVSIGFIATDYEFKDVNGESVLVFKGGEIYELSAVSVGSLPSASIDQVKSLIKDHKCTGLSCSIKALKEMNPNCGCQMEKEIKEEVEMKTVKDVISKGLTWDETENDKWNRYEMLERYLDIFEQTIGDNWFEVMWNDQLTGDEVKANVMEALMILQDKILAEFDAQTASVNKSFEEESNSKTVITYGRAHPDGTSKSSPETTWDGPKERAAASVDDLKIMSAYVIAGKEDLKGSYKLLHHKASDGHSVVLNGVQASIQRLYQTDMPDEERKGAYNHLAKHSRDDFGIEPIKFEDLKKGINIEIDYENKRMVIKEMENMKTKDIETEQTTDETVQEPIVENTAVEEPDVEPEKTPQEVEQPVVEEPTKDESVVEEPQPEKEPEPVNPAQELIGKLSTFSLDTIETEEELEAIEEQVEKLREKLDEFYTQVEEQAIQIIGENENE